MNFLDLFAGIGGFRLGMEMAGHECVGWVECDPYCEKCKEITKHMPSERNFTICTVCGKKKRQHARFSYETIHDTEGEWTAYDITSVTDEQWQEFRGKVDVICGGFPCQAFSVAGKRQGFEDARGTLFFEIARAAKQIKPRFLFLENVKGLVGHDKGRTLNTIVQTLCDIGYTVDFNVLNSKYFGVPQNRERVFIIAVRNDLIEPEPWTDVKGNAVVPKGKRRIQQLEGVRTFNFDWPEQKEVTTRLRDILESDVDEKYYLDEEKTVKLVAQLSEKEDLRQVGFIEKNIQGNRVYDVDGIGATLASQTGGLGGKGVSLFNEPQMLGHVDIKGHDSLKRVYSTEGQAPAITTMGGGHREPKIAEVRPVLALDKTPIEYSRKNGVGKEIEQAHTLSASDWRGLNRNQTQNAVLEVRPVLSPDRLEKRQNGRRFKDDGEESFTLTSQDRHGVALGTPSKYRIRKLTPLECWRLQGFPDWAFYKAAEVNSDSQLYKQAGNSVTVNVIYEIAKRL